MLVTRRSTLAASFLISVLSLSPVFSAPQPGWYTSYEEAVAAAKKEGKPILADFSTTWCKNCRDLEKYTLAHPEVEARLDKFIKVHVDGDQRPDMVQSFKVNGYPTLVAMTPQGAELDRQVGFVEADTLKSSLDNVISSVGAPKAVASASGGESKAPKESRNTSSRVSVNRVDVAPREDVQEIRELASVDRMPEPVVEKPRRGLFGFLRRSEPANREVNFYNMSESAPKGGAEPSDRETEEEEISAPAEVAKRESAPPAKAERKESEERTQLVANASNPVMEEVARHKKEMVVAQAVTKPSVAAPISAPVHVASKSNGIRPLLKLGAKKTVTQEAPAAETTAASEKTVSRAGAEPVLPDEKPAKVASKADPLATIRKLQGEGSSTKQTATKSSTEKKTQVQTFKTETADDQQASADKSGKKPALQVRTSQGESVETAASEEGTDGKEVTSVAADRDQAKSEENASTRKSDEGAAEGSDSEETTEKKQTVTLDDVERWMRDGDQKLVAGKKKEARAMYEKIVREDPKNSQGRSDMAFVKSVSLMVDQDDDKLRNDAYNKIKEFEGRFPNSSNKDYYTLIRATLAADLGKTNEAHSLLQDYPERFPSSRYLDLAHQTFVELPPVKPETKSVAKASENKSENTTRRSNNRTGRN